MRAEPRLQNAICQPVEVEPFRPGVAYVLNYQIIASVGATVASTVICVLPVVAIILASESWASTSACSI
jgi:hypothetical protein